MVQWFEDSLVTTVANLSALMLCMHIDGTDLTYCGVNKAGVNPISLKTGYLPFCTMSVQRRHETTTIIEYSNGYRI